MRSSAMTAAPLVFAALALASCGESTSDPVGSVPLEAPPVASVPVAAPAPAPVPLTGATGATATVPTPAGVAVVTPPSGATGSPAAGVTAAPAPSAKPAATKAKRPATTTEAAPPATTTTAAAPVQPTPTTTPKPTAVAQVAPVAVTIANFAYAPTKITVAPGQKIVWTNTDEAPHTVTFDTGDKKDLGNEKKGQSVSITFAKPGVYTYICQYHDNMHGTVTVR